MSRSSKIPRTVKRHNARVKTLQALYQYDIAQGEPGEIIAQFHKTQELSRVEIPYFEDLLRGIVGQLDTLDASLLPCLDRKINELDSIERSILRIVGFELKERLDIPYRVVINEAVELAKTFGADQSHKYINGVSDKLARELRSTEFVAAVKR